MVDRAKNTGRWEVGSLSFREITKGGGTKKKILGSRGDVANWDVTSEKEPSDRFFFAADSRSNELAAAPAR